MVQTMTPNNQRMWYDIAEAIEPYCVNGAGYIRDYVEDPNVWGFKLLDGIGGLNINALGMPGVGKNFEVEGIPLNGAET